MATEPSDHNVQNPIHIPAREEDYIWSEGDLSLFEGAERVEDVYDLDGNYVGSMVYWPQEAGQEGEVEWVDAEDLKGEVEER
jgi:hypothetical protein